MKIGQIFLQCYLVTSPIKAIIHGEHPEHPFRLSSFLSVSLLYREAPPAQVIASSKLGCIQVTRKEGIDELMKTTTEI
jgi:hypothetical protein